MDLKIRPAKKSEYEAVRSFYYELIDRMQDTEYHPKWQKGVYPADEYLQASVENGQLYLTLSDERIVGAMILNHSSNDGYENINWSVTAKADEVTVIHALGVMPDVSRKGIGRFMVNEAIKIASAKKQKAIRLDVLCGNLPAEKLYKSVGFEFAERVKMFYEDTGWCNFDLYEYAL